MFGRCAMLPARAKNDELETEHMVEKTEKVS
jgi:hypothetical protein